MANIKSQVKRARTNDKTRLSNNAFKSSVKTAEQSVFTETSKEAATVKLSLAYKKLDKAQAKGMFHKNNVARRKSALASYVNGLK